MSPLRGAIADALGPKYRVEREVRPVGDCRMFVACRVPAGAELLVKILPSVLSLGIDAPAFERELLLLADRLRHPNLVAAKAAGRAGQFVFHARDFIEGTTLRAWIMKNGPVPLARAVDILRDILTALAHLHAAQLAHGDVRPENVLMGDNGALLADAGIVGAVGRAMTAGSPASAAAAINGAAYRAPGPHGADGPTARDDMFAVGVVTYEMLTGRPPLPKPEPLEQSRTLPAWLPELLDRCSAAKPAARWSDAGEALAAMQRPLA